MPLTEHIEELCQAASQEQNPKKLLFLVAELNKELDRTTETPPKDATLDSETCTPVKSKTGDSDVL